MAFEREYTVGVFAEKAKTTTRYNAYTLWYNPQWPGCYEYHVMARNGAEAKRKAIELHKQRFVAPAKTAAATKAWSKL